MMPFYCFTMQRYKKKRIYATKSCIFLQIWLTFLHFCLDTKPNLWFFCRFGEKSAFFASHTLQLLSPIRTMASAISRSIWPHCYRSYRAGRLYWFDNNSKITFCPSRDYFLAAFLWRSRNFSVGMGSPPAFLVQSQKSFGFFIPWWSCDSNSLGCFYIPFELLPHSFIDNHIHLNLFFIKVHMFVVIVSKWRGALLIALKTPSRTIILTIAMRFHTSWWTISKIDIISIPKKSIQMRNIAGISNNRTIINHANWLIARIIKGMDKIRYDLNSWYAVSL